MVVSNNSDTIPLKNNNNNTYNASSKKINFINPNDTFTYTLKPEPTPRGGEPARSEPSISNGKIHNENKIDKNNAIVSKQSQSHPTKTPRGAMNNKNQDHSDNLEIEKLKSLINQEEQLK